MTNLRELAERFDDRLRKRGLGVPAGVSIARIQQFEAWHHVQLPVDIAEFLLRIDGMAPGDLDPDNHVRIYSLNDIKPLVSELPEYSQTIAEPERAFVVADFLIWSFGYAMWLSRTSVVSSPLFVVGDGVPIKVADSFAEFLAMYLEDSPQLHPAKPSPVVAS